ncbi:MAG: ParB/Srx family N-terminal domain-containing protein [Devosia sp.]
MPERQFKQLVENVQRDGCLTSAPLVYPKGKDLVVLSGNHRVKAAVAAGLAEISVIEIQGELTKNRQTAIQLSHNAIVGEDDQNLLRELYESLDVMEQLYSGITDNDLQILEDPEFSKLRIGPPVYEELILAFLPEDRVEFEKELASLAERAKKTPVLATTFEDYHDFYDALSRTQAVLNITNVAVAIRAMTELATRELDRLDNAQEESDGRDAQD